MLLIKLSLVGKQLEVNGRTHEEKIRKKGEWTEVK